MHQLKAAGVNLPKIYVCDNKSDAEICRSNGIPYVIWKGDDDSLIKLIFYPVLKKLFPYIKWEKLLGIKNISDPGINYNKTGYNYYGGVDNSHMEECKVPLAEYCGDLKNKVNVEQLQDLKLLPKFLGDIADNIRMNYDDYLFVEGWNKKYGASVGNYGPTTQAENLIIVDVSASIPFGIAATLLALADTMRSTAKAGLIVTGAKSLYFDISEPLPSPRELRRKVPRGQEGQMFALILKEHIVGKHFGNVICFGDNDSPEFYGMGKMQEINFENTKVDKVWGYHIRYGNQLPGYCLWTKEVNPKVEVHTNRDWCSCIEE